LLIILIIVLLYPLVTAGGLVYLNTKGLLPGTPNYRQMQQIRSAQASAEIARAAAISARYRAQEDGFITQQLALEAPKVTADV
jgi:hypothetical protein